MKKPQKPPQLIALNLTSASPPIAVCVLCCGCKSVLQKDGTALTWNPYVSQPHAACFPSAEEADAFAAKHGWECKAEGIPQNHRCPPCRASSQPEPTPRPRGAHIDARLVIHG